ncbi:TIGR02391 family protein [Streptomyces sp. NBC_00828]|uniref:TIGR02391 family protein n=1 Tax=Streptomyces sp. NBC_00828 TaxID=2903678 RepID=UPI003864F3CE
MNMRATAPKGMPRPTGDKGYRLLNAVWQQFALLRSWPTFERIERALNRDGIEFEHAVAQLPDGLLVGTYPYLKRRPPKPGQEIQLSLAGAVHCDDSAAEVKALLGMIRVGGIIERDRESERDSAPTGLRLDPEVLRSYLAFDVDAFPSEEVTYRAAHLALYEPWCSGMGRKPEKLFWEVSFGYRIRPFVGVTGLADYWSTRTNVLYPETAVQPAPFVTEEPAVAPAPAPPASLVVSTSVHPEVAAAAAERFGHGQYADAVMRAFQAVEHRVQILSGLPEVGARLMGLALGSATPMLVVTQATGPSLPSEREGFRDLFKGAMTGLRNPRAHGPHYADDSEEAQEMLAFASLLMRRLDHAEDELSTQAAQAAGTP